jgi:hypothetical protein
MSMSTMILPENMSWARLLLQQLDRAQAGDTLILPDHALRELAMRALAPTVRDQVTLQIASVPYRPGALFGIDESPAAVAQMRLYRKRFPALLQCVGRAPDAEAFDHASGRTCLADWDPVEFGDSTLEVLVDDDADWRPVAYGLFGETTALRSRRAKGHRSR